MKVLAIYLIVVNSVTFIVYGVDKYKAIANLWRIPEKTLLIFAGAGGSVGALLGMFIFHHKVSKPKFYLGVPGIFLLQLTVFFVVVSFL